MMASIPSVIAFSSQLLAFTVRYALHSTITSSWPTRTDTAPGHSLLRSHKSACNSPDTLTDGVTKVPKGCSEGFWHLWHCLTQRSPRTLSTQESVKPIFMEVKLLMPREAMY
jgi:hypothetical protein